MRILWEEHDHQIWAYEARDADQQMLLLAVVQASIPELVPASMQRSEVRSWRLVQYDRDGFQIGRARSFRSLEAAKAAAERACEASGSD